MSYQHFAEDLDKGIKSEYGMVEILKSSKPTIRRWDGYNPDFDLYDDFGYTTEVKTDFGSKKSENVAIEYECEGKPSGINSTKALDWIHIFKLGNNWVYSICKSDDLRKYIMNHSNLPKVRGGDDGNSMVYLIKKSEYIKEFGYRRI